MVNIILHEGKAGFQNVFRWDVCEYIGGAGGHLSGTWRKVCLFSKYFNNIQQT